MAGAAVTSRRQRVPFHESRIPQAGEGLASSLQGSWPAWRSGGRPLRRRCQRWEDSRSHDSLGWWRTTLRRTGGSSAAITRPSSDGPTFPCPALPAEPSHGPHAAAAAAAGPGRAVPLPCTATLGWAAAGGGPRRAGVPLPARRRRASACREAARRKLRAAATLQRREHPRGSGARTTLFLLSWLLNAPPRNSG